MTDVQCSVSTDPYILMEIIRLQTEIAKHGLDLSGVVNAVVERIPTMTNAEGAISWSTPEGDRNGLLAEPAALPAGCSGHG